MRLRFRDASADRFLPCSPRCGKWDLKRQLPGGLVVQKALRCGCAPAPRWARLRVNKQFQG